MSNHAGSYMLNEVIKLLETRGVLDLLGREKTQELVLAMIAISEEYDCNPGEILEGHQTLGVCFYCLRPAERLDEYGYCENCGRLE